MVGSEKGWPLLSEHSGAFLRLQRLLSRKEGFSLCFLTFSDSAYRDRVAAYFAEHLRASTWVKIDRHEVIGTELLFDRLNKGARGQPAQLSGLEHWKEGLDDLLARLNHRRDALAARCPRPLLFWVLTKDAEVVATRAADLWAWRSGLFAFSLPTDSVTARLPPSDFPFLSDADAEKRRARMCELQDHLGETLPTLAYDVSLLIELGDLQRALGDWDSAERTYKRAERASSDLDDRRRKTLVRSRVADLFVDRGRLDAALRIFTEEALPVYEQLGDVHEAAVTRGWIADILQARGEFDEALRIRTEDQLPVYERLGDVRSAAVAKGRIADILQARGEFDEALRIRTEDQLPVYERLGDVRSAAVAKGRIADILQARGELDEALRIRTEDELPVYERLGDVRSAAMTKGQVADILQARGELDEALRIRTEDELPVYERLGDVRSAAVAKGGIADIFQARGRFDEALRIRTEDELPVYERLGDVRAAAVTKSRIADILQARGQLDEALRVYSQEVLPAIEALGNRDEVSTVQRRIDDLRRGR